MHGGDRYRNCISLDFSVNSNPLGLPETVRCALYEAVEECRYYPDIQTEALRREIGRMAGIREEDILCGNGASELFVAIIHGIKPGKVLIPIPSFYGYERAARAGGGEIRFYTMEQGQDFSLAEDFLPALSEDIDLLFLANPNNPVGNLISQPLLEKILAVCRDRGIFVVLDECFLEFHASCAERTFIQRIHEFPNLIVVRAFTKIFAMPGVRLGYLACADSGLRERIEAQFSEWNVSVFAQRAGIAAARETAYREETTSFVVKERVWLKKELQRLGMTVFPSEANFLLFYSEKELGKALLKRGILIRDCSDFRGLSVGFYRVAVRRREDNRKLLAGIEEVLHG